MNGQRSDLIAKHPLDRAVTRLDGADLRLLIRGAYDWLAHHYETVNRMNVFPVPDGDTGTNMLLTIKSAWSAVQHADGDAVGPVMRAVADGARHGSRGNSGVILGQILLGMSRTLADKADMSAHDLADALQLGAETAYQSVPAPVEGTILTAARAASVAARESLVRGTDMRWLFAQVVDEVDRTVQRTPELLPILRQAGVVDSGAKGLYFVLAGMQRALSGELLPENPDAHLLEAVDARIEQQLLKGQRRLPAVHWGFDVQFLVEQPRKPVSAILEDIAAMGECPLVEGDENLVKVHVHVADPGAPLSYGVRLGFLTDVVVENMDDLADAADVGRAGWQDDLAALVQQAETAVVAVAPGPGFAAIFRDLGVQAVVRGGQTMNPSVAELVSAVRETGARQVLILPNNRNILLAAQQAAELVTAQGGCEAMVVRTSTVPHGIAALMAFAPQVASLAALAGQMETAAGAVATGEITRAVREVSLHGVAVAAGELIGLSNGHIVAHGGEFHSLLLDLLEAMDASAAEIITIYRGEAVSEKDAENLAEIVRSRYPEQDIESAFGGQPHYHLIVSVE